MFGVSVMGALLLVPNDAYAECSISPGEWLCSTYEVDVDKFPYQEIAITPDPPVETFNLELIGSQVTRDTPLGVSITKENTSGNAYADVTVTTRLGDESGLAPLILNESEIGRDHPALNVEVDLGNITVNHNVGKFVSSYGSGMRLATFGGDITVNNGSTVIGSGRHGVEAHGAGHVSVTNSSFNSMLGLSDGANIDDSNQTSYHNDGGLTAGLTKNGLSVSRIAGRDLEGEYAASVKISNRDSGSITGGESGVYLGRITRSQPGDRDIDFYANAVLIDNSGTGEEDDRGGLIAGFGSNGITAEIIGGNFVVMNQNTLASTQSLNRTLDELFVGERGDVDGLEGLGTWAHAQGGITGIFGNQDGISVRDIFQHDDDGQNAIGGVDINNDHGLIVGTNANGINLRAIGVDKGIPVPVHDMNISNAGGYIVAAGADDFVVHTISQARQQEGSRHGINIQYAAGDIYINNGASSAENTAGGGLIASLARDLGDVDIPGAKANSGAEGHGVHIEQTYGNVFVNNYRGLIFSGNGDAVNVEAAGLPLDIEEMMNTPGDEIYRYGAAYIGYHNEALTDTLQVISDDVPYLPPNAAGDDYYIAKNGSAIEVKNTAHVYVNTGGLAIGSGQRIDLVPDLQMANQGDGGNWNAVTRYENFRYVSHQNSGILASRNLPGFGTELGIDNFLSTTPIGFFDADENDTYINVDSIWSDVENIRNFVVNMNDAGVAHLYGYGNAADDMLVYTTNRKMTDRISMGDGPPPDDDDSPIYMMDNSGLMVGRVSLEKSHMSSIGNSGNWFTRGWNELGYHGFLHNEEGGLIQTAFTMDYAAEAKVVENEIQQEDSEQVVLVDLPEMNDYEPVWTRFNTWGYRNDGMLSMTDGETNDKVSIHFHDKWREDIPALQDAIFDVEMGDMEYPYSPGWSGNGYLGVDVDFYEGRSDVLWLLAERRYVEDNIENVSVSDVQIPEIEAMPFYIGGSTGIISNTINTMPGNFDGGITVVEYGEGGMIENGCSGNCKAGDAFYISEYSEGYAEVDGIGFVTGEDSNWLSWYLVHDEEDRRFEYQAGASPGGAQLPGLQTQMQNVWYETQGVVSDHIRADRFGGSGLSSTSNADLVDIIPEAPQADAERYNSKGIWAKIQGSWTNRDTAVNTVIGGGTASFDTSYDQDIFSILGGFDMLLGQNSPVRVGVFGGYINSSADFNSWATSSDADGGTVGAYVDYTKDNFYVDATFKADFLNIDYSTNITGVNAQTGSADVTNYGVEANAGYRFNATHGFIEPIISATYVHTQIDNFALGGVSAGFSNADSIRGGVGARVGTNKRFANGMQGEFTLLGKVWNEFENANQVTLVDTLGNTASFTDGINGVFGEVEGGINIFNAAKNASAFVSGGAEFNSDFTTYNAKAGFRWMW